MNIWQISNSNTQESYLFDIAADAEWCIDDNSENVIVMYI